MTLVVQMVLPIPVPLGMPTTGLVMRVAEVPGKRRPPGSVKVLGKVGDGGMRVGDATEVWGKAGAVGRPAGRLPRPGRLTAVVGAPEGTRGAARETPLMLGTVVVVGVSAGGARTWRMMLAQW